MICLTLNTCGNHLSEHIKNEKALQTVLLWCVTAMPFSNSVLGCRYILFYFFPPFENLSIVVVVTLATASIALLCLLTSAEKKRKEIHLPIEHVGTNF